MPPKLSLTEPSHCRSPGTPSKSLPGEGGAVDLADPEVLALIGNRAVKTVNKPSSKSLPGIRPARLPGKHPNISPFEEYK